MRKIYLIFGLGLLAATSAKAQQLPNVGFEEEWQLSYPWNTVSGTSLSFIDAVESMPDLYPDGVFGKQPASWIVSNVLGIVSEKTDGSGLGGLGATEVGNITEGYNSESALVLKNAANPFMASQIVPAYVSLGTSWATNGFDFATFSPSNKDGGVFGGMEFAYRPDAISFMYKRSYADAESAQKATVLVYAWKGTWTQSDVPGNNTLGDDPVTVDMVNRDRNILGMETAQGGAVTKTDDAELIAKTLEYIDGEAAAWTSYSCPISYLSDATPEMINVVIAANEYFDSDNIFVSNSLTVDDVKFVYYSRLASLKVGGIDVPDFKSDVYSYTLNGTVPAADAVEAELLGEGKSATVDVTVDGNTVKVTVANVDADIDGEKEHVYTLTYESDEVAGDQYDGFLNIKMMGGDIAENQPATIYIESTGDSKCTIMLPDFALDLGSGPAVLGDIIVPDVDMTVAGDVISYTGHVTGMSLLEGQIIADVDLTGTTNSQGDIEMNISVMWNNIPIDVVFSGKKTSGIGSVVVDGNAPVEYYNLNGMRVDGDNLQSGLYIRRQGKNVTKVLVK